MVACVLDTANERYSDAQKVPSVPGVSGQEATGAQMALVHESESTPVSPLLHRIQMTLARDAMSRKDQHNPWCDLEKHMYLSNGRFRCPLAACSFEYADMF